MKKLIIALILSTAFFTGNVYADPSAPLNKAMHTPASIFDFFLHSIEADMGCSRCKEDRFCLYRIEYDFMKNVIYFKFHSTDADHDFKESNEETKKTLLLKELDLFATRLGVKDNYCKAGIVRYGWRMEYFNEDEFRKEVAKRTVIIVEGYDDDTTYIATRDQDGKIEYMTQ